MNTHFPILWVWRGVYMYLKPDLVTDTPEEPSNSAGLVIECPPWEWKVMSSKSQQNHSKDSKNGTRWPPAWLISLTLPFSLLFYNKMHLNLFKATDKCFSGLITVHLANTEATAGKEVESTERRKGAKCLRLWWPDPSRSSRSLPPVHFLASTLKTN